MKRALSIVLILAAAIADCGTLRADTTITYQGRLDSGGQPYTGTAGIVFELYDAETGGVQHGPTLSESVSVVDGLFQTELDFGAQAFDTGLWLAITVNGQTLSPRQRITGVPLALHSDRLGGAPAAAYRAWPLQVTRATNGATIDSVGGPSLNTFGTSGNYPTLSWYYSIPPLYEPGSPAEAILAVHSFSGSCAARVRVWGLGAFGAGQEQTVSFPSGGGSVTISRPISNLGTNASAYIHVARHGDHADDTCTGNINIAGMHVIF